MNIRERSLTIKDKDKDLTFPKKHWKDTKDNGRIIRDMEKGLCLCEMVMSFIAVFYKEKLMKHKVVPTNGTVIQMKKAFLLVGSKMANPKKGTSPKRMDNNSTYTEIKIFFHTLLSFNTLK